MCAITIPHTPSFYSENKTLAYHITIVVVLVVHRYYYTYCKHWTLNCAIKTNDLIVGRETLRETRSVRLFYTLFEMDEWICSPFDFVFSYSVTSGRWICPESLDASVCCSTSNWRSVDRSAVVKQNRTWHWHMALENALDFVRWQAFSLTQSINWLFFCCPPLTL